MKTLFLALSLLVAAAAGAGEDTARKMSVDDSLNNQALAQAASCYAVTYCPNLGTNIWCRTYGAGCSWRAVPGVFVHCEGYDVYGDWQVFHATCF